MLCLTLLTLAAQPRSGSQPARTYEQQDDQVPECRGLTLHQVALAWMTGVAPIDAGDAAATCVPALVIAAGCSFNTTNCPHMFDPEAASGISKGLWLSPQTDGPWDPTPKKQAETVYNSFMGDGPSGCTAPACKLSNCGEAHYQIGQYEGVMEHHRFCRGHWMADTPFYLEAAEAAGGMERMKAICVGAKSEADKETRAHEGGDSSSDKVRADQDKLTAYVRKQIGSIWVEDLAETMSTMVVTTLNGQGINTLKDAADVIGKGDLSKAEEIVALAGVELEPQLLKEWMESAGGLLSAVNANRAVAAFAALDASKRRLSAVNANRAVAAFAVLDASKRR